MAMLMSAACVLAGNIKDVWLAMPNSVAPYLNSKLRTQLVTFNQTGANPSVTNLVGGETRLDTLTESFMQVRMSDVSTLQLRLLPRAEGDSLVCVVKTVAGPQKRSQVSFYGLDWAPLSIQLPELPLPARPDTMSVDKYNRLISIMEGRMTYASLHAGDDGLTMGYSVIYATQDELKELNGFNKERELVWDGRQFR